LAQRIHATHSATLRSIVNTNPAVSQRRRPCQRVSGVVTSSPGEADVVRLVALGHTNREMAELLGVSLRTVEARRGRAMSKLGVTSRAELVRRAFESGLVYRP
jgi:DNA-binding NarL/FixJ family response regulator